MEHENYDPMSSRDSDYLSELLDENKMRQARRSRRAKQSGSGKTRGWLSQHLPSLSTGFSARQLGLVVIINVLVSATISLVVVGLVGGREHKPEPSSSGVAAAQKSATVGAATVAVGTLVAPTEDSGDQVPAATPVVVVPSPHIPATPTPRAVATQAAPVTYIVQTGDTLISIADQYDVTQEDLMRVNGLDNPDYLLLGQQLVIPVDVPVSAAAAEAAPMAEGGVSQYQGSGPFATAVPTPTAVPASEIRLTLDVLNPGDVIRETVYLANNGLYVKLTGWTLSDQAGNTYTFPDLGLGGGGAAVNLHTAAGADTINDLFWNRPLAVWEVGEEATLRDATGTEILTVVVQPPSVRP